MNWLRAGLRDWLGLTATDVMLHALVTQHTAAVQSLQGHDKLLRAFAANQPQLKRITKVVQQRAARVIAAKAPK